MQYQRHLENVVKTRAKYFPVIVVTGPRQSGKTTFMKQLYPEFDYYNLENMATLELVKNDPLDVLESYKKGLVIDEVQRFPEILSYIQAYVDERKEMGKIIISGSQNLLISEKVGQTLAGRVAYCYMYPLSINELKDNKLLISDVYKQLRRGGYPAIYDRNVPPELFYDQYISTYVERDVRMIREVADLIQFRKFLVLLAGRVGRLVNLASLANDVGVTGKTIEDWLSVLEASFVIYRHVPYFQNVGKRLIKSPKIYFCDTGVLCYLLGLTDDKFLKSHHLIGQIFENYVVNEINKLLDNEEVKARTYFYRDSSGSEVDLLIEQGERILPVEIKISSTFSRDQLKGIKYWQKLINSEDRGYIINTGKTMKTDRCQVLNWQNVFFANLTTGLIACDVSRKLECLLWLIDELSDLFV